MLGLSAAAAELGLAGIIGAFVAGLMLGESREHLRLEHRVQPIYEFLTPFFFVITGAQVDLGAMFEGDVLALCLAITALAIAGKVIACGAGAYGLGRRSMGIVGVGMVPRGEIGFGRGEHRPGARLDGQRCVHGGRVHEHRDGADRAARCYGC